jgi:hypothetical protein
LKRAEDVQIGFLVCDAKWPVVLRSGADVRFLARVAGHGLDAVVDVLSADGGAGFGAVRCAVWLLPGRL